MSSYGYTPGGMIMVAEAAKAKIETFTRSGKITPADRRHLLGGLENIVEVLQFCRDHEAAIAKAAKKNVPWRASR